MDTTADQILARWLHDWRHDPAAFAREAVARGGREAGLLVPLAMASAAAAAGAAPQPGGTDALAMLAGAALLERGWQVALAESCTGGGVATALTAIAGSSAWVEGGCVTYSNAAKQRLLGVPGDLIEARGAVSIAVVEAMARGARARLDCACAVAVSGVAGPGGGSPAKPVGTVCLAWCGPGEGQLVSHRLWFPGDRAAVRAGAVWTALTGLLALARA